MGHFANISYRRATPMMTIGIHARIGRAFCALLAIAAGHASAAEPSSIERERDAARAAFVARLDELAHWCEQSGLAEQAVATRAWRPALDPLTLYVPMADDSDGHAARESDTPRIKEWRDKFVSLRDAHGKACFELARQAAANGHGGLAMALVSETLREDPRHAEARRIAGHVSHEGTWRTPFEAQRLKGGQVWHERFGWINKDHVSRYEAGERYCNSRWMPAADEARVRSDIDRGWDVFTEHYAVRTNHSLEEGVRLAARLERLYDVWRQVFARFHSTDEIMTRRFEQPSTPRSPTTRMQVVYYRDRDEYVAALTRIQPQIGITSGYYLGAQRKAFFYADETRDDANLLHEATHQLFSESRRAARTLGRDGNFWAIEGVACYMESMVDGESCALLGGRQAPRLANARRRLDERFHVPLAQLVALGMESLQRHAQIADLYAEGSGLTFFFMHARSNAYRDPFIDYLSAIYSGRDRAATLAELTRMIYASLDAEYAEFLTSSAMPVATSEP